MAAIQAAPVPMVMPVAMRCMFILSLSGLKPADRGKTYHNITSPQTLSQPGQALPERHTGQSGAAVSLAVSLEEPVVVIRIEHVHQLKVDEIFRLHFLGFVSLSSPLPAIAGVKAIIAEYMTLGLDQALTA